MARGQRFRLYAVGADPLLIAAVAADIPDGSVRRFRSLATPLPAATAVQPDVVLIGPDVPEADVERASARRWWGTRPVVVEVIAGRPQALVWFGLETVRVVEIAPGFLSPFLVAELAEPGAAHLWQPVRGRNRIAHAAAALLIMAVLSSAAFAGWVRSSNDGQSAPEAASGAVAIERSVEPLIDQPACLTDDPC